MWKKDIIDNIATKKYAILIGDVMADTNMLPDNIKNDKITIAFLDNNIEENLELYNKYFDMILIDNKSFKEIEKLLKII